MSLNSKVSKDLTGNSRIVHSLLNCNNLAKSHNNFSIQQSVYDDVSSVTTVKNNQDINAKSTSNKSTSEKAYRPNRES